MSIKTKMPNPDFSKNLNVAIQVSHDGWCQWFLNEDWLPFITKILQQTFSVAQWNYPSEVSVLLTSDEHIQELNLAYRGKNKPTNVLSFSNLTKEEIENYKYQDNNPVILGDIVLSLETVLKEVEQEDKLFLNHVMHLVVHGALHLLGYDHEADSEAEIMESLESDVLSNFGVADPYQ